MDNIPIILTLFAICFVLMAATLFFIYRNLNRLLLLIKERNLKYWSELGSPYYHLSNFGDGKTSETMAALQFGLVSLFGSHARDILHDEVILVSYNKFRRLILLYNIMGFPVVLAWIVFVATALPGKSH